MDAEASDDVRSYQARPLARQQCQAVFVLFLFGQRKFPSDLTQLICSYQCYARLLIIHGIPEA